MADGTEALQGEQSLAQLLEFLSKLEESSVKTKVIKKLRKEVGKYITNKLADFATEDAESGYLCKTIESSKELRSNIVKTDGTYKHYSKPFQEEHKDIYTKLLIDNAFPLFGCLYYMYYECSNECNSIEGGNWWAEKCNETSQTAKKHLNNCLTDATTTERMIQRGFKEGELSNKTGSQLFGDSGSNALLHYREAAQLQSALFFMLFLPEKWKSAQSGHAVLFLEALCKMVSENKFNGQYSDTGEAFKNTCRTVEQSIQKLMGSNTIVPVACSYTVKYETLLEAKHFWQYIEWLQGVLPMLIDSLQAMAMDVKNWEKNKLISSDSFGPYPWGFTFAYNWENDKEKLPITLLELHDALKTLQKAMDKIKPVSSTASTIGSVIGGLGGLGATAGAAYAGSGFLGPAAEAIGRFFKGLLF